VTRTLESPGRPLSRDAIARVGPVLRPLLGGARPSTVPVGGRQLRLGAASDFEETEAAHLAAQVERPHAPLRPSERLRLEAVRVHAGDEAARSASATEADAYAVHGHIVFGAPRYDPATVAGRSLIAHELFHALREPPSGAVLRRQQATGGARGSFTPARTIVAYISLVREAEKRMIAAGISSVDDRIQILSGIYYGTDWSLDLEKEKSQAREVAFRVYTARTTQGRDPRPVLGQSLFDALKASQDVAVPGIPDLDIGHALIGLNARSSGWTSRNVSIPTQGGTGLELSTWVGDLGAATGRLADDRTHTPTKPARAYFPGAGTDYGADSNLEGDLAATSPGGTGVQGMVLPAGGTIADALQAYFGGSAAGSGSRRAAGSTRAPADRARNFLTIQGGTFVGRTLSNRATIEAHFAAKFEAFGRWYMAARYGPARALGAVSQTSRAAADVAREFVDWLLRRVP